MIFIKNNLIRYCCLLWSFFCYPQLFSQNVLISNLNEPNEPSIMMDPKNPNILVAASNINNYYFSSDTGNTWTSGIISSTLGVWGDPVISVDTACNFYFFHLSNPSSNGNWLDRIVCQKSIDNGSSWSNGSFVGLNGNKDQDKQWCIIDRNSNTMYLSWTQFDNYGSTSSLDSSIILFSKSQDLGATWSVPKRINKIAGTCLDDDNTVEGAVPAVGPNGEIYVSWAGPNGLVFNKSLDWGENWLPQESFVDSFPGGWDFSVDGIYRVNGLPITTCDISGGPNNGTIYITWGDQRNGNNNGDIWIKKSVDGGLTWSAAKRVNNDQTVTQQFFPWSTIDQSTGFIYVVFYDRRNYTDSQTDVYIAVSTDGGETFINKKISESPFTPTPDVFFGDYTNIVAHNGIVRPIWTRLNNGQLSVWTDLSNHENLITNVNQNKLSELNDLSFENFPNPSSDYINVSYKLNETSLINLSIYNSQGILVKKIIDRQFKEYGKYKERLNLKELELSNGFYLLKLEINGQVKTKRQVFVNEMGD